MPADQPTGDFATRNGRTQAAPNPLRVLGIDLGTTNSMVVEIAWNPEGVVAAARCLTVQ